MSEQQKIRLAHSPDADDAFMFWALSEGKIETGPYRFEHILSDIESLNRAAFEQTYEVSATSVHALPYLADNYALLTCGGSFGGDDYGPRVVAGEDLSRDKLLDTTVAIPGELTSAALSLQLWLPGVETAEEEFDQIIPAIKDGKYDAGVIIHEGQLTYADEGLYLVQDMGEWWAEETGGLPLPLGCNIIRKDLGEKVCGEVAGIISNSIRYGLDNREEALDYALDYGRGLSRERADRFVGMYVNELTVDMGDDGRRSIELFLKKGREAGIIDRDYELDTITPEPLEASA